MKGIGAAYGLLISVLVGAGLGFAVDHFTHLSPLGLLIGIFLGFGAGLYSLYIVLMANTPDPSTSSTIAPREPSDPHDP